MARLDSKGQTKLGTTFTYNCSLLQSGGVGLRISKTGWLYVADPLSNRILGINTTNNGGATNVAYIGGTTNTSGYTGDGGPAYQAQFNSPNAVAIDSSGNLFVADAPPSNPNQLHLIEAYVIAAPVVKPRGAGRLVCRDLLRDFQPPAVFQIRGNSGCAERVAADFSFDAGRP